MPSDRPKPRKTQRLSSTEIERMRVAAEAGSCVECARRQGTIEEQRQELHRTHRRVGELEASLEMLAMQVQALHEKVQAMVGDV